MRGSSVWANASATGAYADIKTVAIKKKRIISSPNGIDLLQYSRRLLSTLLTAIADFERDLIRERTGEGRTRAMANGVKFGRKRKLSDYQRAEAIKRRDAGETLAAIAKSHGVAISMISRL